MKKFILLVFSFYGIQSAVLAQSDAESGSLGLPGDNFNLYAALKVFQESKTLEEFEQKINNEELKINNLDLDGDNQIDFIRVTDHVQESVHNITLDVAVNKDEKQNVAVFMVNKVGEGKAEIQVIGDEDLYGKDYIIEPQYSDAAGTPNPGYTGNTTVPAQPTGYTSTPTTYSEVYQWPVVQFIFVPMYRPWVSPWYWGYYPGWWRPWNPYYWHWYYGYHYHWHYHYYGHYRRCGWYRHPQWHNWYYGQNSWRRRSPYYNDRYRNGLYRKTYSRPEMLGDGSKFFKTRYPQSPGANNRLPDVSVPGFKPDVVKPVTRPAVKPGTRPTDDQMGINPTRPSTKPTKPSTKPVKPVTRPVDDQMNTSPTRPSTKPVKPVTRPVDDQMNTSPTRPSTKPVKPSTRPSGNQINTSPTRPSTRPSVPTTRPSTMPAPRPATRNVR